MFLIVDLIVLAVIALCIFLGYKRGLISACIKLLSFFIAIILSFILYMPVSNYIIDNTQFDEQIERTIISAGISENVQNTDDSSIPQVILEYIENAANEAKDNVINSVARDLAVTIIRGVTFIGIFLILKVLLIALRLISNIIASIPIIKQFNKIGGTIYGIIEGLFIVYLVFAIISLFSPLFAGSIILSLINDSIIGSFFYNQNILLKIVF